MRPTRIALALVVLAAPLFAKPATKAAEVKTPAHAVDESYLAGLSWREVGPYRGGRSAAVTGVVGQRDVYYFGGTGGGVWKTENSGRTFTPVSDGFFGGSIGAVAVAEFDPNVIFVGTGEKTVRGNVSHGDGVWKSTDAGKTWKHVGLADTRHIPRVRIHPKNPDLVYVAALGHLFGPNEERGVFRSKDGGATWSKILFVNPNAGAIDLILDPVNPRIVYASFWRVLRTPSSLESGGEGSSLWKSTDGGDTWSELTKNPGLPKGTLGIIGITVSASNNQNLYAIVEAEDGGVFRSKDGGATWTLTSSSRDLRQRAWYYSRIYADPKDEEVVYAPNVQFHRSKDGGKTFTRIRTPHGDNHDLWIDPQDPQRLIGANDGGAHISNDGGETWTGQENQPTAQFYRVTTDNAFPYRLLGGQQDNSTVRINHRSAQSGAITARDWETTAGCECGHVVAKGDDPEIVFGGCYGGQLEVTKHKTGETRNVSIWPDNPMGAGAAELKYRFQWNFPIFFSPHDANRVYAAANVLFKSDDLGQSWQAISPDLTRDDKSKQGSSGGPITKDNTSVEYYGTIFAALESRHEKGVLWAGSDDGKLHLSRDGGGNWSDVTPPALPEWSQINSLEAHPTEPGGLYLAATRYKLDDFRPSLWKTRDYGKTWTEINGGIDPLHFTRVVRADPKRPGLLYAGTERGVYVSFDDGARWQSLQLKLPIVPITDLALKNDDLIAATQGRAFWILDDVTLLHQLPVAKKLETPTLFAPRPAHRLVAGAFGFQAPLAGKNPPAGVSIRYFLPTELKAEDKLSLEILDAAGQVLRTFTRKPSDEEKKKDEERFTDDDRLLESGQGLKTFTWDLTLNGAETFPGAVLWNGGGSVEVVPGRYSARLTVGDQVATQAFEVLQDPRGSASLADLQAQFEFNRGLRDQLTEIHRALRRVGTVKKQLGQLEDRLGGDEAAKPLKDAIKALREQLDGPEQALYQTKNKSPQDPLNYPIRLNDKLAGLWGAAAAGQFRPTDALVAVRAELGALIEAELAKLRKIFDEELPKLNAQVQEAAVAAIKLEDP